MFERLNKERNEARGTLLLQEFNDVMFRIESMDGQIAASCIRHMVAGLSKLQENFGPLTNVSNNVKTELANILREEAKNCFDFDMGRGYGTVLLSIFLESATLPNEDARYVHESLKKFLNEAAT
jgi:hypothetical protein